MTVQLTPIQARIIGCLLEKESTTPDQYPLSLNSLQNACNQKSNREPVLQLSEQELRPAVEDLVAQRLVMEEGGARTMKYKHRFCNTPFGGLQLSEQERGLICVLLLRGAQTPGELRSRSNRLCELSDVKQTETVLNQLIEKGFVRVLPREPGKRESRYLQLFTETDDSTEAPAATLSQTAAPSADPEVQRLKQRIAQLEAALTNAGVPVPEPE